MLKAAGIGENHRRLIVRAAAYNFYRWIVIWLILAGFASQGDRSEFACGIVIVVDTVAYSINNVLLVLHSEESRSNWLDVLTNRCFYKNFWAAIYDKQYDLDVDDLFRVSTKEARQDIEKAEKDEREDIGLFGKPAWRWLSGPLSFVGQCMAATVYYGSALYLGFHIHGA